MLFPQTSELCKLMFSFRVCLIRKHSGKQRNTNSCAIPPLLKATQIISFQQYQQPVKHPRCWKQKALKDSLQDELCLPECMFLNQSKEILPSSNTSGLRETGTLCQGSFFSAGLLCIALLLIFAFWYSKHKQSSGLSTTPASHWWECVSYPEVLFYGLGIYFGWDFFVQLLCFFSVFPPPPNFFIFQPLQHLLKERFSFHPSSTPKDEQGEDRNWIRAELQGPTVVIIWK